MNKSRALKKVEIAIDKIIELEDFKDFKKIAEPRARVLELLREISSRLL
jgi:hypothetical protein